MGYRANQQKGFLPIGNRRYRRGDPIDTDGISKGAIKILEERGLIVRDEEPEKESRKASTPAPPLPEDAPKPKAAKKKTAPKPKAKKEPAKKKTRKRSRK